MVIHAKRITKMLPVLEGVLTGFGKHAAQESFGTKQEVIRSESSRKVSMLTMAKTHSYRREGKRVSIIRH